MNETSAFKKEKPEKKPVQPKLCTVQQRMSAISRKHDVKFTDKDAKNIGAIVISRWRQRHRQDPPKKEQQRDDGMKITVFAYPGKFVPFMDRAIFDWIRKSQNPA